MRVDQNDEDEKRAMERKREREAFARRDQKDEDEKTAEGEIRTGEAKGVSEEDRQFLTVSEDILVETFYQKM